MYDAPPPGFSYLCTKTGMYLFGCSILDLDIFTQSRLELLPRVYRYSGVAIIYDRSIGALNICSALDKIEFVVYG